MATRKKLTIEEQMRLAVQRQNLLNGIASGEARSLRERVAYILNHYPETRNSNVALSIQYYQEFHSDHIKGGWIQLRSFYDLPKMYDMQRERARIQNDYGLFLAKDEVRRKRLQLAEDARLEYGSKDDVLPVLSIYSDESGKNSAYTIIGTVWFYNANRMMALATELKQWKSEHDCPEEFKFSELTYGCLPLAEAFFSLSLSQTDLVSFKAVAMRTDSAQHDHDQIVYRLYLETLQRGIEFELDQKRLSLPRVVWLAKDQDRDSDALWHSEYERKLKKDCEHLYTDQVRIMRLDALDSSQHELLQIADLLSGSVSRIMNRGKEGSRNQKDEFAESVCQALSIDPATMEVSPEVDWVMTHVFD